MKMNPRVRLLKELVGDGLYVVDEGAVAHAVVLRATVRWAMPGSAFGRRCPQPDAHVRSFRPHRGARSFRLSRSEHRPVLERGDGVVPGLLVNAE